MKTYSLLPAQRKKVDRLKLILHDLRVALDTSETGTGKTITSLFVAKELPITRVLVVCPKAVIPNWKRTASSILGDDKVLTVINPEAIGTKNSVVKTDKKEHIVFPLGNADPYAPYLVIWDEPHRSASGVDSRTTRRLAAFRDSKKAMILLCSATFASTPLQCRAFAELANFAAKSKASFYGWCYQLGCVRNPWAQYVPMLPTSKKAHDATIDRLATAIAPYSVHVSREQIQDFPESKNEVILVSGETPEGYEWPKEKEATLADAGRRREDNALIRSLRKRQKSEPMKLQYIVDETRDLLAEGKSVVVFVQFIASLKWLSSQIPEAGVIYGEQTAKARQQIVDDFVDDKLFVVICQANAGGVGISLHNSNGRRRESFICPGVSASEYVQCLGRIHRAGGTNCHQTTVVLSNSEERLFDSLEAKLHAIDTLNDADFIDEDLDDKKL